MKKILFSLFFLIVFFISRTQTLGGSSAYNFLKLPATPMLTAMGGINVSYKTNEVGASQNNPALLFAGLNSQMNVSFNSFLGGIQTYNLTGAYYHEKMKTTFSGAVYFVDYGSIPQTDAAGNVAGNFHPVDYVVQLSAARQYLEKWNYGATVKLIQSNYQLYKSSAIAVDFGVHYSDSVNKIDAGIVAKNMGVQFKTYAGANEDLPFDLQVGVTKKLENAPFGFSLQAQHIYQFNTLYNDVAFNNENNFSSNNNFFNKIFNHFVIASHIYLGENLEATVGYNHLRRTELNIGPAGNGLNGFSMGVRAKFLKWQVLYARSNYQRNISYNQLGLTLHMNQLFALGKNL